MTDHESFPLSHSRELNAPGRGEGSGGRGHRDVRMGYRGSVMNVWSANIMGEVNSAGCLALALYREASIITQSVSQSFSTWRRLSNFLLFHPFKLDPNLTITSYITSVSLRLILEYGCVHNANK